MAFQSWFLLACFNNALVSSMTSGGRSGHGLIGYGIEMYNPTCAFACRDSIASSTLTCTTTSDMADMPGLAMDMGSGETEPDCYATDDAFLQTLAWCISIHCKNVPEWKLEKYWKMNVAGHAAVQPIPKETYQQTLARIVSGPNETLVGGDPLNKTSLVSEEDWLSNFNADSEFETQEVTHERYGIVLLVSGFVLPIAFSLLRFVPWPAYWISKFNAIFIYPPALGSRHNQAILGIAHVPTRGQAFFILYLITINVVLSSVGYHSKQPNGWYTSPSNEIMTYVTNRVGVLSFANVPLLILYAGRNNILLQLTNWSHGTFLLLHRWVAFLCTVEAVIHSAIYLKLDVANASFSGESKLPYWIWGSVATLGMSILLLTSIYPLRRSMYELFLAWHIALSILIVVGCYLHILYRFQHQWGYEVWMFVAMAVWGFDRVMRVAKLARNGLKTATATTIDENYVRVDVDGVFGDGHAYLYFPTLTWRVWENHPFSVASSILMPTSRVEENPDSSSLDIEKSSVDAAQKQTILSSPTGTSISSTHAKPGMTFFIRTRTGLTSKIRHRTSFPVLVESPYSSRTDLSEYSHLICIAGGVGITAVLPYLRSRQGRKKLLWGVRKTAIVDEMSSELKGVDTTVFIGERMNVRESLTREIEGIRGPEKVVVVSSGPEELADSIRREVTVLARQGLVITLLEEAFDY